MDAPLDLAKAREEKKRPPGFQVSHPPVFKNGVSVGVANWAHFSRGSPTPRHSYILACNHDFTSLLANRRDLVHVHANVT